MTTKAKAACAAFNTIEEEILKSPKWINETTGSAMTTGRPHSGHTKAAMQATQKPKKSVPAYGIWEGPSEIWCATCRLPHPAKEVTWCDGCLDRFCPACKREHDKGPKCDKPNVSTKYA